jgi:hypothetical protein
MLEVLEYVGGITPIGEVIGLAIHSSSQGEE